MEVYYSVQEDRGCHSSEPCWTTIIKDVTLSDALISYKENENERQVLVSKAGGITINSGG